MPFGDKLAMRFAGVYENRDSYTDNLGPSPSEPGSGEFSAARIKLAYQPTDGFGLNVGYEYFDNDTEYHAIKNPADLVTSDPFVIEEDAITFLRQKGYRGSVELVFDTDADVRFRWISSVQRAEQDDSADGDRTATAPAIPAGLPATAGNRALYPGRVAIGGNEFNYTTSEFNVLSTGDARLQWVVGAYYLDENIPLYLERDNYNTVSFVSSSSTILTESDAKSQALFGQINYRITDGMELIAGLRTSEDEFTLRRDMITGPPPPGGFPYTDSTDSSETTGRLGLNFFPSDNLTWYGTYSKGYKPGATNLTPGYPAYLPETNEVLEFGAKTTLLDNRLRLNSAVFYSEIENFQLLSLLAVGGGQPLPTFQNGTKGESQGVELELTYARRPARIQFLGQLPRCGLRRNDVLNNGNTGPDELVPAGRDLPFAPELTISGGIQYALQRGRRRPHAAVPGLAHRRPIRDAVSLGRARYWPSATWPMSSSSSNATTGCASRLSSTTCSTRPTSRRKSKTRRAQTAATSMARHGFTARACPTTSGEPRRGLVGSDSQDANSDLRVARVAARRRSHRRRRSRRSRRDT